MFTETLSERDVDLLKQRIEAYFNEKFKALQAEKARALQAADALLMTLQSTQQQSLFPLFENNSKPRTLISAVQDIVSTYKGPIDINKVREIIEAHYPDVKKPLNPTSISNSLKRLQNKGILVKLFEGRGKIPTTYKVSENWLNNYNGHHEEEEDEDIPIPRMEE